jgi:hypothetical protein
MEQDSLKEMKSDMTSGLMPFASEAATQLPSQPALSGFARSPGYGVAKGAVKTNTSGRKRTGNSIVRITVQSTRTNKTKGLLFTEFAGTKSSGFTPSGRAMIRNLNAIRPIKRGAGRFTYNYIRSERPAIIKVAEKIIDGYMKKAQKYL